MVDPIFGEVDLATRTGDLVAIGLGPRIQMRIGVGDRGDLAFMDHTRHRGYGGKFD